MIFLKSNGIVVFKKDIEEADRYISIFLEDFGRVSSVIKGIRKSKRRDKVAVDLLALSEFTFYKKNDNIIVSSFNCIEDYSNIKKDFNKLNKALYLISILNQVLFENTKNRKIYDLTVKSLNFLNKSIDEKKDICLILYFLYEILKEEGIISSDKNNFDIEKNEIFLTGKKYHILDKEILEKLFMGEIKFIVSSEKFKIKDIFRVIIILEDYINDTLGTYINAKKIMWEEIIW
ncbi:MAG: DNA repair protein RecO [Fusobacteriales bacterium]|nr:MAG: DNA repair protein RecO [Fusobacteriales bacterium]